MSAPARTPNRGADDERMAIMAHMRRRLKKLGPKTVPATISEIPTRRAMRYVLETEIAWLQKRSERTAAKPKGLGRK